MKIICVYYILDFITTSTLSLLFVWKLLAVRTKSNDIEIYNKMSNYQIMENVHLTKLAKKTLILTAISVISSWFIMYPSSVLSTNDMFNELRWFYPLDYGINGLCLFLMFEWNIFIPLNFFNFCVSQKLEKYVASHDDEEEEEDEKEKINNNQDNEFKLDDVDDLDLPESSLDEFSHKDKREIDGEEYHNNNCIENLHCKQILKCSSMHKSRPSMDLKPEMQIITTCLNSE